MQGAASRRRGDEFGPRTSLLRRSTPPPQAGFCSPEPREVRGDLSAQRGTTAALRSLKRLGIESVVCENCRPRRRGNLSICNAISLVGGQRARLATRSWTELPYAWRVTSTARQSDTVETSTGSLVTERVERADHDELHVSTEANLLDVSVWDPNEA